MISRAYPASIRNDWRHRAHLGDQTNGTIFQYLTIRELAQLWCVTWDYLNQEGEGPDTMREWLTDTYQSCFAAQLGVRDGYEIHSKAGWTFGYDLTSSEGGYVISPGGTYLLVVMTNRSGSPLVNLASLVPALDRVYQEYAPQKAIH